MRKLIATLALTAAAGGAAAATASADPAPTVTLDRSQLVVDHVARLFRPDLAIAGTRLDRANATLTVSVANTGLVGVRDSVSRVAVFIRNPITLMRRRAHSVDVPTGGLAPGEVRDYVVDLDGRPAATLPVSPFAEITVSADANRAVAERDERNNEHTIHARPS